LVSDELIEALVRFWRMLHTVSAPIRQGDITAQQFWLLRQLRRMERVRITDLAAVLGIAQSSGTVAVQRLEAAGLLRRERSTEDERVVWVSLTEAGAARVDAWRQHRRSELERLLGDLDRDEQEQLRTLLERVLVRTGDAAL